ncbi:GNAT family N-acetyltransferase [Paenibacillus radicis (ex Xue et al. 2023)]|uniref:GNAT family N-acetyltransferase n=1 Tax=Paenibacillus radicis (ex Xue et al. 2023) TaxID=2972489 RepID=A0ABT1YAX1_9BACL|nr:GNAT family N-acetyltransferase [Paenibacillus radicis (ex Xue et al. 2023)]MCR8630340.1 GNAT family N-acetyltransferase [Paenibacillus radicis (ex Xue et al. 2023)]
MISNENIEVGIDLVYDYKDNKAYRKSFNQLATLVFHIDFEAWYLNGFWDDRYICYSFMKDNEVIANVSVSKMDLVINGLKKKAIQIGTVMTHPDFRGKGLSGVLMRQVLNIYEQDCDIFFLFANSSVIDFYPKFGFESFRESQFKLKFHPSPEAHTTLRKLNCSILEDLEFIKRLVLSRRPVSQQFGVSNNQGLFMFYALNVFSESIFYSQEDEAIIVFQHEGHTLNLYDVVSQGDVNLDRLLSRIANEKTEIIQFHFTPDQLTEKAEYTPINENADTLFIKANFMLDKNSTFCAPILAHA